MNASDFCQTAASLVAGDRARTHGDKLINHDNIAQLWTAWLRARGLIARESWLSAHDAAAMMALLKLARTLTGSLNKDDYVDGIGYIAIAGEIAERCES